MGLLSGLLTLPLAPVQGVAWIAERLAETADCELHDPAVVRAQLAALNEDFDNELMSAEEFEKQEERLLDRLEARGRMPRATVSGVVMGDRTMKLLASGVPEKEEE
jgi:hypothetical protein